MTYSKILKLAGFIILWLGAGTTTQAMTRIEGTRLIYPAKDKEISVRVTNDSAEKIILQAWISAAKEEIHDIPFAIIQPLVELDQQQVHILRILYMGEGLPSDKESLFLLNVVEAPLKPQNENNIQMAIRQKLKLFFRPTDLQGSLLDCIAGLTWKVKNGSSVEVTNTCAFHLSLVDVQIEFDGRATLLSEYTLLKPREKQYFTTPNTRIPKDARIKFLEINDSGLRTVHKQKLRNI